MGKDTAIQWTDHTWNPWQGCTKVSAGCKHCYMYRDKARYGQDPSRVVRSAPATFRFPLSGKVKPGDKVFVCSWSDFFHETADQWRTVAWNIIRQRPDVIFQLVTKRPERIERWLPSDWGNGWPNVWGLVSVEDQAAADLRIPQLLALPFAVRGVSAEPLLEAVDFSPYLWEEDARDYGRERPGLDWVIAGGESGPGARPMHPDWARGLRDQCAAAGVPFFFKQWGEWLPISEAGDGANKLYVSNRRAGPDQRQEDLDEVYGMRCTVESGAIGYDGARGHWRSVDGHPSYLTFRVGKARAGRLLDGVEHNEFPAVPNPPTHPTAPSTTHRRPAP